MCFFCIFRVFIVVFLLLLKHPHTKLICISLWRLSLLFSDLYRAVLSGLYDSMYVLILCVLLWNVEFYVLCFMDVCNVFIKV